MFSNKLMYTNLQERKPMTTREEWLTKAKDLIIEQIFKPHDLHFSPILRVSVGPCPGKAVGFCCDPDFADDGAINMFVTPEHGNNEAMDVLSTLTHEIVHAQNYSEGHKSGHGHQFTKIMKLVGLEGKPKSCGAHEGTELFATLTGILMSLGEYPHAPIRKKETKKRLSENLTWISSTDPEYSVKCKFSLSQDKGVPRDYNGEPMVPKDPDKFAELEDRTVEDIEEEEAAAQPE